MAIVGGCGRVGLPLGLAFAERGLSVALYDINEAAVATVNAGTMPFLEEGAPEVLARVGDRLLATTEASAIAEAECVIVVIGTPLDDHLNPRPNAVPDAVAALGPYLRDGQLLVLRSTLYPGGTAMVEQVIARLDLDIEVSFCPERIAEGKALTELYDLPQIVAARTSVGFDRAEKLFRSLTSSIVRQTPEEAELTKLFTNTWRYAKFAIANQFFMIANDRGIDFDRIRDAMVFDYPRAQDFPSPGFAAGPCLFKDTMQLVAFDDNDFPMAQASITINEELPDYVVARVEARYDLSRMTVGVLGMSFKAGSDDVRESLSYRLRRILEAKAATVLCTDPYVTTDPSLVSLEQVLAESDLLVVATPHEAYRSLTTNTPVIDIWTGSRV